jgi:type IV secretory pathway TraG/TraD family ATPase VirD4
MQDRILRAMMGPSGDGKTPPRGDPPPIPHSLHAITQAEDPWLAMHAEKRTFPHGGLRSQHLGNAKGSWMAARHEGHALVLAPPRSEAGKTSGVIIPNILSMRGQVVVTSTKTDVVRATAIARAQLGRCWCYAPDGETPIPSGLHELRWSPLTGSEDWGAAIRTAHSMTQTLSEIGVQDATHWTDRATDVLSAVFHWAALTERTMAKACEAILSLMAVWDVDGEKVKIGNFIVSELRRHPKANKTAASVMLNLMSLGDRELSGIISTATRAVQVYQLPGAIRSTENPNFAAAEFVRAHWGESTIYIISSRDNQRLVAPLVVALLAQIRRAQYTWIRTIEHEGLLPNVPIDTWTTTFVLDEMANIAPIPKDDLTSILSEGGSQGLLLMAAVQDLALIEDRWKTAGQSFLTLFGDVIIAPGIRHRGTIEAVSALIGDYDAPSPSMSQSTGQSGSSSSQSMGYQRRRLVPPEMVHSGLHPNMPTLCIHLSARGNGQLMTTRWWKDEPWPWVLAACAWEAYYSRVPLWVRQFRELGNDVEDEPPVTDLPLPDLRPWMAPRMFAHPYTIAGELVDNPEFTPWAHRYKTALLGWDNPAWKRGAENAEQATGDAPGRSAGESAPPAAAAPSESDEAASE